MNVIIKINGREAIPVRALPLLAKWGTMHPQKIAGALGRVTDDDCCPLFGNLHDINAFYIEAGTVNPLAEHHWSDHIYRNLEALSDTIKHTEITHKAGHSEWRVKALGALPKDAFVWKDEYEMIYDRTYGVGSRTRESGDAHTPPVMSKGKPSVALNFSPLVEDDMQPLVQDSLDAIGWATGNTVTNTHNHHSRDASINQQVEQVPLFGATPVPAVAGQTVAVETVEQRRARYLAWHTEEMRINSRGALRRVFERERKQNPKADRSAIGKDIKKARATAKTQKATGAWTSQLVADGKRKG